MIEPVVAGYVSPSTESLPSSSILESIFGDGFLWAVQTKRRSLERRHTRLRCEEKMHKIRNNLKMCVRCGHFHEYHTICGHCYEKVREETKAMQAAIDKEWNSHAVDKEVAVVYEGETNGDGDGDEFWHGKRIVEMKKPRPHWFVHNLRVKTFSPPSAKDSGVPSRPSSSIIERE